MLEIKKINVSYGPLQVLFEISLDVKEGEIVCLAGRNGAGKTTLCKAIMGLLPISSGEVNLDGESLIKSPSHLIPRKGIALVPQGRRLFSELTVGENLEIGLMNQRDESSTLEWIFSLFPRLEERLNQVSSTLSGGEQQMLAMARALCLNPKVLILDEPTEGLQPSMVELIRTTTKQLVQKGVSILLVEQRFDAIIELSKRVVIIENGRNRMILDHASLVANPSVLKHELGV